MVFFLRGEDTCSQVLYSPFRTSSNTAYMSGVRTRTAARAANSPPPTFGWSTGTLPSCPPSPPPPCPGLYCTVMHCTVLYCTVLYCTVLYCTVLYCSVLYCVVLYCTPTVSRSPSPFDLRDLNSLQVSRQVALYHDTATWNNLESVHL